MQHALAGQFFFTWQGHRKCLNSQAAKKKKENWTWKSAIISAFWWVVPTKSFSQWAYGTWKARTVGTSSFHHGSLPNNLGYQPDRYDTECFQSKPWLSMESDEHSTSTNQTLQKSFALEAHESEVITWYMAISMSTAATFPVLLHQAYVIFKTCNKNLMRCETSVADMYWFNRIL